MRNYWFALLCLLALSVWARPAHAAQDTSTCDHFITSLPTTISTVAGTYCLQGNLSVSFATTPTTVQAITLSTPYPSVLDCNNFTITQTSPNAGQTTYAIYSIYPIAVRNCNVKGFSYGIWATAAEELVEDNHLDGNGVGITAGSNGAQPSSGVLVRHNEVLNSVSAGIVTAGPADVVDNTVSGVTAAPGSGLGVSGIMVTSATSTRVEQNQVSGLTGDGAGAVYGLNASGSIHVSARWNTLVGNGSVGSTGFSCSGGSGRAMDNVVAGFAAAFDTCGDAGGNDISP